MVLLQNSLLPLSVAACLTVLTAAKDDGAARPRGVGPECKYSDIRPDFTPMDYQYTSIVKPIPGRDSMWEFVD